MNAPDASAAEWTSGPGGDAIGVQTTPGERTAVQMRIGHYAFGCADVDPLAPASTLVVPVQIYDVPMALTLTDLESTFSFTLDVDSGATAIGSRPRSPGRVSRGVLRVVRPRRRRRSSTRCARRSRRHDRAGAVRQAPHAAGVGLDRVDAGCRRTRRRSRAGRRRGSRRRRAIRWGRSSRPSGTGRPLGRRRSPSRRSTRSRLRPPA